MVRSPLPSGSGTLSPRVHKYGHVFPDPSPVASRHPLPKGEGSFSLFCSPLPWGEGGAKRRVRGPSHVTVLMKSSTKRRPGGPKERRPGRQPWVQRAPEAREPQRGERGLSPRNPGVVLPPLRGLIGAGAQGPRAGALGYVLSPATRAALEPASLLPPSPCVGRPCQSPQVYVAHPRGQARLTIAANLAIIAMSEVFRAECEHCGA